MNREGQKRAEEKTCMEYIEVRVATDLTNNNIDSHA
jgi:hypothetical protein